MTRLAAPIIAIGLLLAGQTASAQDGLPYPDIADTSRASPEVVTFFTSFFSAKSRHDVATTMAHFAPAMATYTDATLGMGLDGFDAVEATFEAYMPNWGEGLSYPTRILGEITDGEGSALVAFTDTPELFGDEIRILGAVDVRDGRIVRWVDYWDSSGFDTEAYEGLRAPAGQFPADFMEATVGQVASPGIVAASEALQQAFAAGDVEAAAALFSYDAVYEDMSLRTQVVGQAAIERYLERALAAAPFGAGSSLRHVVGGDLGGGVEWRAAPDQGVPFGVTALELDADGWITRATVAYDGRLLSEDDRTALALAALEP